MSVTPSGELKLYDHTQGPRKIGPGDGKFVKLMSVGVRFMAWGEETGGGFSLVEHPIAPNTLAAPVHIHEREDEYSYVLEGRMGALLGDKVVYADEGDFVFKPRNQWHTFWNAGDRPCRILEIISPSGFEHFFDELAELVAQPNFSSEKIVALGERYGHYFDLERTAAVAQEHGLHFPMPE
jgi:mannose-6-phosphate isomerase-like protein (cupin superfamily)